MRFKPRRTQNRSNLDFGADQSVGENPALCDENTLVAELSVPERRKKRRIARIHNGSESFSVISGLDPAWDWDVPISGSLNGLCGAFMYTRRYGSMRYGITHR